MSLVTNLNFSSTAQEIVNWVTTTYGCVHTSDATQLDSCVASAVSTGRKTLRTTHYNNSQVNNVERTHRQIGGLTNALTRAREF